MKKKKTYVFREDVLKKLEELKDITDQTETQILSDAINRYLDYLKREKKLISSLDYMLEKIEKLSIDLGRCQERVRYLEERLSKNKNNK
jgi:predicted transcriptional regulator